MQRAHPVLVTGIEELLQLSFASELLGVPEGLLHLLVTETVFQTNFNCEDDTAHARTSAVGLRPSTAVGIKGIELCAKEVFGTSTAGDGIGHGGVLLLLQRQANGRPRSVNKRL